MKTWFSALPVWIVLLDMVYGFGLNISQSVITSSESLPADGLAVSPAIAFDGLQVLANGGMVLIIGFGLLVLLRLNRTVLHGVAMQLGVFSVLGLIAVAAFALPSWWEWLWSIAGLLGGTPTISWSNPRYLLVALCLPWVAALLVWRLFGWYRLARLQETAGAHDAH
ncbi:MAG: hypothetical protein Q4E16_07345 [Neisseria sp.]|nr:hypothetical protein [Neisseria sp.]